MYKTGLRLDVLEVDADRHAVEVDRCGLAVLQHAVHCLAAYVLRELGEEDGNRAVRRVVAKGLTKHFSPPIDDFEELLDVLAVGPGAPRDGDDDGREDEGQHVPHKKAGVVVHGVALDVLDERVYGVRNLRLEESPKALALQAFHALALPFFDVKDLLHPGEPDQPSHFDLIELDAGDGVPKVPALSDELGQRDGREVVLVPRLAHAGEYRGLERPHGDRVDPALATLKPAPGPLMTVVGF